MDKERKVATVTTDAEGWYAWLLKYLSGPIGCTQAGSQDGMIGERLKLK